MKLRYKILSSIGAIGLLFTIAVGFLIYPFITLFHLSIIVAWVLICSAGLFAILKMLIFNRLDKINNELKQNKTPQLIKSTGRDEIDKLIFLINNITTQLLSAEQKISQQLEERPAHFSFVDKELHIPKTRLSQLAHYDSLTALPNRVFFNEMLNKTLMHARRHNKKIAILFIDIDRFKDINDAIGIKAANLVLKEIANRFTSVLRSGDIIARLGGDEFVILLNDIGQPKYASSIADKILQVCTSPIVTQDKNFYIKVSIGICIFPNDGASLEDLQKNADLALYKAKSSGGGAYHYFSNDMTLEANTHIQLNKALRKALLNNEFVLYYQPKLSLANGAIKGVEALVRWENPEIGLINPSNFIPQAEESGLILQIGEWVLREACRANKSWQDHGYQPISVAVNLSPLQFNDPNIVNKLENILAETGIDPKYLEIEITESTMMENVDRTAEILQKIKHLGIKICIDDFGTGYTSISFLKKFPIDVLKIDQSFIKGIPKNNNDVAIAGAIISLGQNLNLEIVAEGVETIDQLHFLTEHNCDFAQGYYFSRPLPEPKMVLQLEKRE